MAKLRKTLFVSQKVSGQDRKHRWQAPYIFFDRHYRKWYEDTWYFDNVDVVTQEARARGFAIG